MIVCFHAFFQYNQKRNNRCLYVVMQEFEKLWGQKLQRFSDSMLQIWHIIFCQKSRSRITSFPVQYGCNKLNTRPIPNHWSYNCSTMQCQGALHSLVSTVGGNYKLENNAGILCCCFVVRFRKLPLCSCVSVASYFSAWDHDIESV